MKFSSLACKVLSQIIPRAPQFYFPISVFTTAFVSWDRNRKGIMFCPWRTSDLGILCFQCWIKGTCGTSPGSIPWTSCRCCCSGAVLGQVSSHLGRQRAEPLFHVEINWMLHYFLSDLTEASGWLAAGDSNRRNGVWTGWGLLCLLFPAFSSSSTGISLLLDLMVVALHKYPQIAFESLNLHHLTAAISLCSSWKCIWFVLNFFEDLSAI